MIAMTVRDRVEMPLITHFLDNEKKKIVKTGNANRGERKYRIGRVIQYNGVLITREQY